MLSPAGSHSPTGSARTETPQEARKDRGPMHPKSLIALIAIMCVTASRTFAAEKSPSALASSRAAEPRFQAPPRARWCGAQPVVTDMLAAGLFLEFMATFRPCIQIELYP